MQTNDWKSDRDESEKHPCEYCTAQPEVTCWDPRTGRPLMAQAAHLVRQKAAGVAPAPRMSAAYVN